MVKTYGNYIDGEWVESDSGETFKSINPARPKQVVGVFQKSDKHDIITAVDAAENAFQEWSSVPAPKRGEILFNIAQILRKEQEELAEIVTKEMGKVIKESIGEIQFAINVTEYMAGEGRRLFGHTTPSELKEKFCMTIRMPIGVVGLITPWNFPVLIPAWKLMPALICGNTIVIKPAPDTSLVTVKLINILEKAGVPEGVVNMVTGPGVPTGAELVKNRKVRGISFTGHIDTGKWIIKNAGLKRVGLELGGKNPIIVMDDANLGSAVNGIMQAGFATTGQRCTAASRVIVHEKVKKDLEKALVTRIKKLRIGSGLNPKTDLGPLVNQQALEKVERYTKIGKDEGAKLLTGGKRVRREGFFYMPTLFTNCTCDMKICQEEIFGPTVSLITIRDLNEAINAANSIKYGLSSSIYTNSISNAFKAIKRIEAGITYVNGSTAAAQAHLPFGGVKGTGNGIRESGIEGINEFSNTKTVYVDHSGKTPESSN